MNGGLFDWGKFFFSQVDVNTQYTKKFLQNMLKPFPKKLKHDLNVQGNFFQGSYGSWKTWKVLEFYYGIF